MAITAATSTGDFAGFLSPDRSAPIFDGARRSSVAMQLARQIPLGANGVEIPVTTSKPTAGWVAEGGKKPATAGGLGLKTITPKKLAAIAVVSAEVVRANPGGYMDTLRDELAEAFAVAFDAAALHGTSTPFTTYVAQTTKTVALGATVHTDINDGLALLVNDKKRLTGFAFDSVAEPIFNAAVDSTGRPLYIDSPLVETAETVRAGRLLGRPTFIGDGVGNGTLVGFGGDWNQAVWGVVGGITYDVSTEAPVTINGQMVSLWENNLVAVRAEAEYGWLINDSQAFVEFTSA